jgi:hypothetical protein
MLTSKLEQHQAEVDKDLEAVRKEMSNLKQGVTEKENERENVAKLEEFSSRLDRMKNK